MITYDHLWWLKTTQDVVLGYSGLYSNQKNMKIRQGACFFQGASDDNAPGRRNTIQKS